MSEIFGHDDAGLANVNLPNGARYYVDHAHPEYSTPECIDARGALLACLFLDARSFDFLESRHKAPP